MTSGLPAGAGSALDPVRGWLVDAAEGEAAQVRAAAEAEAAAILAAAHEEAGRIRAAAVAEGEAAARSAADRRSAQVRRAAQEAVLAQQEELRQAVRDAVVAAARTATADPRYPSLRSRLAARGREVLGPDADVTEVPAGGVVVAQGSRWLDLTLPALAEEVLGSRAADVEAVWAP